MAPREHDRPNRLRRKPLPKRTGKGPRITYVQTRFEDEPHYYCGNCLTHYVSYDYPSERVCPYCGHSEV